MKNKINKNNFSAIKKFSLLLVAVILFSVNAQLTFAAFSPPDTTPPVIVPTVSPAPNALGWNNSDVTVSWSISDLQSTITSSSGCDSTVISDETNGLNLTCSATSRGGTSSSTVTIKLDKTAPVINISTPANGGKYEINQAVNADWSAIDALSGITSVAGTVVSGNLIDTSTLGTKSFTVTSTDAAGNISETAVSYDVIDTTPPVITATINITAEATSSSGAVIFYTTPTATDLVDGSDSVTCLPVSGSTFAIGTTTVTCSATDAAGNSATPASFKITVLPIPKPVLPTNKDQCKKNGWQNFGNLFKNQGDCVSFVATDGKNPPSGK